MSTIFITGANRGLGLEFTRQYAAQGDTVLACCRKPRDAKDLASLAASSVGKIHVYPLDIAEFGAADALAHDLKGEKIDILINNAGVYGENFGDDLSKIKPDAWLNTFKVNTVAPILVTRAFLPHLERGAGKRIAFITSKMGSISDNGMGGSYLYRSSKAALNMAVKTLSLELQNLDLTAVVLHPGWVQTDMGGPQAPMQPEESIALMRKTIQKLRLSDSGKFLNFDGTEIPW